MSWRSLKAGSTPCTPRAANNIVKGAEKGASTGKGTCTFISAWHLYEPFFDLVFGFQAYFCTVVGKIYAQNCFVRFKYTFEPDGKCQLSLSNQNRGTGPGPFESACMLQIVLTIAHQSIWLLWIGFNSISFNVLCDPDRFKHRSSNRFGLSGSIRSKSQKPVCGTRIV